jgi:hypothetical protein
MTCPHHRVSVYEFFEKAFMRVRGGASDDSLCGKKCPPFPLG